MRLYIETLDTVLVDYESDGRVKLDGEDWSTPTLQNVGRFCMPRISRSANCRNLVLALDRDATT